MSINRLIVCVFIIVLAFPISDVTGSWFASWCREQHQEARRQEAKLEAWERLQEGMTIYAANELMGDGEQVISAGNLATYQWPKAGIVASFENGRLIAKARNTLR